MQLELCLLTALWTICGPSIAAGARGVGIVALKHSGPDPNIIAIIDSYGDCEEEIIRYNTPHDSIPQMVEGPLGENCEAWVYADYTTDPTGKVHCQGSVLEYRSTYG